MLDCDQNKMTGRTLLRHWLVGLVMPLALSLATPAFAASKPVSFSRDIAPIFINKCQTCHGPDKAKGKYQLHTYELMLKAGSSKSPSITPGKPATSELYRLLTAKDADDRMPQDDNPLPTAQIALIERWIKEGARFDGPDPKSALITLVPRKEHPAPPATYPQSVPLLALAFSPSGQELAVGGYNEITIWNPATGALLRRIKNVAQQTHALAYNTNGTLLAAATGDPSKLGEVALYDPLKGTLIKTLATLHDAALDVKFSPDGTRLASCGSDNAIRIFDVATWKEIRRIEQHADWVISLAWNTNGTELASASRDKTARVFNAATGDLEATFADHGEPVFAVAFTEDGKSVYSAGRERKIRVWDSHSGSTEKKGKRRVIDGFDGDIFQLLLQDGRLFCSSADRKARQYQSSDNSLIHTFTGHKDWVYALAYDAASKRLATGSYDGEVRLWNVEDGKQVLAFQAAPGQRPSPVAAR